MVLHTQTSNALCGNSRARDERVACNIRSARPGGHRGVMDYEVE